MAGVLVLLLGIGGGVALYLVGRDELGDAVKSLARAPIGCDTSLDVDKPGTYFLYVETKGRVGDLDGSCDNDDRTYSLDRTPRVSLSLVDGNDEPLDLNRASGDSYDTGDFHGEAVRKVEIPDAGRYVLTIDSSNSDVVVAVGKDVSKVQRPFLIGAVASAAAGIVLGLLLLLLGRRRRPATTPAFSPLGPSVPLGPGASPGPPAPPGVSPGPPGPQWGPPPPQPPPYGN